MGTEVLRPQNCLIRVPTPAFNHPRRKNLAGNRNPNRKKKPEQSFSRRSASFDEGPVSGHVTILRRGESIGDLKKVSLSPSRADVYAGSTVTMSPSPRALPLPSFFSKKAAEMVAEDCATRDLRRLLRLE